MADVTRILSAIEQGDAQAAQQLLPLVYDELRKLAVAKMAQEKPGHTLQATALVHEAYLRLVDTEKIQRWNSRGHFFAAAAEAMRRILVENARRKARIRHGGGLQRVEFDTVSLAAPWPDDRLIALDEALEKLSVCEPELVQVVNLRHFAALTIPETAEAIGISVRTVNRHWAFAKAWLYNEVGGSGDLGLGQS